MEGLKNTLMFAQQTDAKEALRKVLQAAKTVQRSEGKRFGIGVWKGKVIGAESGVEHGPEFVAAFGTKCMLAPTGPAGDECSESLAAMIAGLLDNQDLISTLIEE